ncbi:VWA domain-containing protein [Streptomyces gamaensis]|uniref:VWA domain-containing protein n=1 Tax=Streptomyces gamaensis TaxID=1763542 RepID=A0ABW0YT11_9ACTN
MGIRSLLRSAFGRSRTGGASGAVDGTGEPRTDSVGAPSVPAPSTEPVPKWRAVLSPGSARVRSGAAPDDGWRPPLPPEPTARLVPQAGPDGLRQRPSGESESPPEPHIGHQADPDRTAAELQARWRAETGVPAPPPPEEGTPIGRALPGTGVRDEPGDTPGTGGRPGTLPKPGTPGRAVGQPARTARESVTGGPGTLPENATGDTGTLPQAGTPGAPDAPDSRPADTGPEPAHPETLPGRPGAQPRTAAGKTLRADRTAETPDTAPESATAAHPGSPAAPSRTETGDAPRAGRSADAPLTDRRSGGAGAQPRTATGDIPPSGGSGGLPRVGRQGEVAGRPDAGQRAGGGGVERVGRPREAVEPAAAPRDERIPDPGPLGPTVPPPGPTPGPRPGPGPMPPEPGPEPEPEPTPVPTPQPVPEPDPSPAPSPEPMPEPEPTPRPVPKPEPAPGPGPVPEPTPAMPPDEDDEEEAEGSAGVGAGTVRTHAPALVAPYEAAGAALDRLGLTGQRAAVYLVLDRSGSMRDAYKNGTVQHFAEQALALAAHLDDDGTLPVVFFSTEVDGVAEISLARHEGRIAELHASMGHMGRTSYHLAMRAVIEHYEQSGARHPAFVVFQTDGAPQSRAAAERVLCEAAGLPLFWQFVGFGDPDGTGFAFLRNLDRLPVPGRRAVDNAGFFPAGRDPRALSHPRLYAELLAEFPEWLREARAAGIVR